MAPRFFSREYVLKISQLSQYLLNELGLISTPFKKVIGYISIMQFLCHKQETSWNLKTLQPLKNEYSNCTVNTIYIYSGSYIIYIKGIFQNNTLVESNEVKFCNILHFSY